MADSVADRLAQLSVAQAAEPGAEIAVAVSPSGADAEPGSHAVAAAAVPAASAEGASAAAQSEGAARGEGQPEGAENSLSPGAPAAASAEGEGSGEARGSAKLRAVEIARPVFNHAAAILLDASKSEQVHIESLTTIRRLISIATNPPIDLVTERPDVMARMVEALGPHHDTRLIYESAWAISNIASGSEEQTSAIVKAGCIEPLVELLMLELAPEVTEQALWALGNVAGDVVKHRNAVHAAGAMQPALAVCPPGTTVQLLRQATWLLRTMARGKPLPPFAQVADALPELVRIIGDCKDDAETVSNCVWGLSAISDCDDPAALESFLALDPLPRMVAFLDSPENNIRKPAMRCIGNVARGHEAQTQAVIDSHALPKLVRHLTDADMEFRKEAAHTLSNIAAGSRFQIRSFLDAKALPPLYRIIENPAEEIPVVAESLSEFHTHKHSQNASECSASIRCVQQLTLVCTVRSPFLFSAAAFSFASFSSF